MGIPIGDQTLYNQILIAGDRGDFSYMFRKLEAEYERWGLRITHKKTKYMVVVNTGKFLM